MKIIGLSGSPTPISRSNWLLQRFLQTISGNHGTSRAIAVPDTVRIRDLPPQALLHADFNDAQLKAAMLKVAQADLVIVATPIYKAAYSGLLKVFLDMLPQDGLQGKAVVALATGGSPAHLLAMDYALKPVLSALGTRDVLDAVYATDTQLPKHEAQGYASTPEIDSRLARAADLVQRRIQTRTQAHLAQPEAATHVALTSIRISA